MLFVSYASQDRAALDDLLSTLRGAGQRVWFDEELGGGETWWRAILEQIRRCEVFLVAVSEHSLASKPCQAELRYAQALQRPILPIQIGPIDSLRLTPLATTQIFNFRRPNPHTRNQVLTAVESLRRRAAPLPSPLPAEPAVPFAYLMRLATALSSPELTRYQQAELVTELKSRLDEDRTDPAACRDITRLLYLLHERPDVTWRTRTDIDAVLAATAGYPANPGTGPQQIATQAFTGPQQISTPGFTGPQQIATPGFTGPQQVAPVTAADPADPRHGGHRGRRGRAKWLIAGVVGLALTVAVTVGVMSTRPESTPPGPNLVSDADLGAIMGAPQIATAESGVDEPKPGHLVEVSPRECAGVLYPGLDQNYQDGGQEQLSWRVSENLGGVTRAGVNNNAFVDQAVALFAPNSDRAAALVQRSAEQWHACAGKTVTVIYPDGGVYAWLIAEPVGQGPRITQSFALDGDLDYTCQRVLHAVPDAVIDVKACGSRLTDQGSRIAARLTGGISKAPSF